MHRQTLQREIVLQAVLGMQGHATADMIYDQVHASQPSISKATVYRNLKVLEKQGKLMRVTVPGGADYFEGMARPHYHIKCTCCGRIFDASLPYMPQLLDLAQAQDGDFALSSYSLLFEGLCPDCRRAQPGKE